jgi:hypothetical protein
MTVWPLLSPTRSRVILTCRLESSHTQQHGHATLTSSQRATGVESWMFYSNHREAMWVPSWSDIDNIERPLYFRTKTILTILFNGTGEFSGLLPEGTQMSSIYFTQHISDPLVNLCHPNNRQPRQRNILFILRMHRHTIQNMFWNEWKLGASEGEFGRSNV